MCVPGDKNMNDFIQAAPTLKNTFENDHLLRTFLQRTLPPDMFPRVEADLKHFGERCAGPIRQLGVQAERNPPRLRNYSAWGELTGEVETHPAWQQLKEISCRDGLVRIGYERRYGEFSRLYQFAKLYLFHPSSAFFSCPLAMADGAARVLELYGQGPELKAALAHLVSSDPEKFWTSGQWMTERIGGSDVSRTETVALRKGSEFELSGVKWFTSAVTSEMALGLARIEGAPEGSKGLSLFYIPMRWPEDRLNGIEVLRLKDKLGTKALPTAELRLKGARALLVGQEGQGVKTVATMLNITRLYNSVCSVGQMARSFQLASDYARKRKTFGTAIVDHPLHLETLVKSRLQAQKSFVLTMRLAHLLGRDETHTASEMERYLLRLLTPIAKLSTARTAVEVSTEMLEAMGGAGYIEDTEFPALVRDAHVFPIWEGTTNVLSLDVLRVLEKHGLGPFFEYLNVKSESLPPLIRKTCEEKLAVFQKSCVSLLQQSPDQIQRTARDLAFHLAAWFSTLELLPIHQTSNGVVEALLQDLPVHLAPALNLSRLEAADILK